MHFQTMVARINWSAEGEAVYQIFGTPVRQVNFQAPLLSYGQFIQALVDGAKVGDRGIVADSEEGTWQVSMNHLIGNGAVEFNTKDGLPLQRDQPITPHSSRGLLSLLR